MASSKSRDWAVTVYPIKYGSADPEDIDAAEQNWLHDTEKGPFRCEGHLVYLYGCMERGKNGKLHCHYRAYFKNPVRQASIAEVFGTNIKATFTADADSYESYIRKEGKFADKKPTQVAGPWLHGDRPAPSRQNMWREVHSMVLAGKQDHEIFAAFPFAAVCSRALTAMRNAIPQEIPAPFETPYAYQNEVIRLCSLPPVPRRWIWVYSKEYGTGKSQLGVELARRFNAVMGSRKDPRSTLLMLRRTHNVIIFDLPRLAHLSEELLKFWEDLSDQKLLVSDKYESSTKFVVAHLVILTNRSPPIERFGDRIKAIEASKVF